VIEIRIDRGDPGDIPLLRELWLSLHHHHAEVAPETGRFCDDDASWRARSQSYREWLAEPGSFLLLARATDRLVGYAVVRVKSAAEWSDTYVHADEEAELETLVVAPELRGGGLGTWLFDEIDAELEARGITEMTLGLIPGNDGAQRFYERRGFKPRWLVLSRESG
jgi:ribosomal protein S18 acetylase RimI-like enzyme